MLDNGLRHLVHEARNTVLLNHIVNSVLEVVEPQDLPAELLLEQPSDCDLANTWITAEIDEVFHGFSIARRG